MQYLDFHCDTLMLAYEKGKTEIGSFPEASVDVQRLLKGEVSAQFFAAFVPPDEKKEWWQTYGGHLPPFAREDAYIVALHKILRQTIQENADRMAFVQTESQLCAVREQGKLGAFFTIEDGRSVDGKLEKLEEYKRLGVSLITLTWNYANCFGFPNSWDKNEMQKGLTSFGKEAVEYMNELGMIVDVSHLSDGGFWDVVQVSKKPFIASHSNCRALSPHPRNLTDEMLHTLAEKGGVTGLNFCSAFLGENTESWDSYLKDMVAQVCHMVQVGGIECAAIGTDFDGIESHLEVPDPSRMEILFDALQKAGLSQDAVERIAWKNADRVLYDILG